MTEREKYIHPIYGVCYREKETEKPKSHHVWIPKPLYKRDINPHTGAQFGEHRHRFFKVKSQKSSSPGVLIKMGDKK